MKPFLLGIPLAMVCFAQTDAERLKQLLQQTESLYREGKYAEGQRVAEAALALAERVSGEEPDDTATALNDLAVAYMAQAQYPKAEPLLVRALAIREKALGSDHPHTAVVLNNLAMVYKDQGQYSKAEPGFVRALAICDKALGAEHPTTVKMLNNLADLYIDQEQYAKAEPLLARALANTEKVLGVEHPDTAASLNKLALAYLAQRQYSKAEPLLERALEICEKTLGAEHRKTAVVLNNLADLYTSQGQYAKAEPLLLRARAIEEKTLGTDAPATAASLTSLALTYRDKGDYTKAEPLLVRALAINERDLGAEHPDTANSLNNLGALYRDLGLYTKAEPLLERALSICEKTLGGDHPDTANLLNNLGSVYRDLRQYPKAEPILERALAIREKTLGADHPDTANSLNNLALLYRDQGEYAKAEALLVRALAIREKAPEADNSDTAIALNNLAELYRTEGENTKAESLFVRALAIYERTLGDPNTAAVLSNLAALYREQGQYAKAEPLLLRSFNITTKALGGEHPATANSLREFALLYQSEGQSKDAERIYKAAIDIFDKTLTAERPEAATALNNLAAVYMGRKQYQRAEAMLVRALAINEKSLGSQHPDSATTRHNLLEVYLAAHEHDKAQRLLENDWPHDLRYLERSLNFAVEMWRRKALADLNKHLSALIAAQADVASVQALGLQSILAAKGRVFEDTVSALLALKSQLPVNLQAKLDQLVAIRREEAGLVAQRTTAQQTRMKELNTEDDRLSQDLAAGSPTFRTLTQSPKVEEVAARLGHGALVELLSFEDLSTPVIAGKQTAHYGAYLLTGDGKMRWLDLGLLSDIDVLVARYRTAMNSPANAAVVKATAREIDHLTLEPIRKALPGITEFFISADGQSRLIPWCALRDENNVLLLEHYQMHSLLTGRDLVRGAPLASAQPAWVGGLDEFGKTAARPRFAPIPGAASEAEAVANVIQPKPQMLEPEQMTKAFLLENVNGPQILHLATHGFYQEAHGGLALRNANLSEENVLSDSDVAKMKLFGTRLVVLSACSTGLGEVSFADGITGLQRALTLAGARSQILTLWPVSDAKTKELMVSFYRNLFEKGMTKAEGLRQAQLAMARQGVAEYYWAPFVLYGDGGPLLGPERPAIADPRRNPAGLDETQGQSAKAQPPPLTPQFVLSPHFTLATRQVGDITIVDLGGKFVIGEPVKVFRQAIHDLITKGHNRLLINLIQISYMDESGIGELITAFTTAVNVGGQLKLVGLSQRIKDLLQITHLYTIFAVFDGETEAVLSFR